MSTADKWLQKSLKSFNSGNDYQGIKLLDIALFQLIEEALFDNVPDYFIQILPIMDQKHLFHEVDLIISKCLGHLKKKSTFISQVKILTASFVAFLKDNFCTEMSFQAIKSILTYSERVGDKELTDFFSQYYPEMLEKLSESKFFEELLFIFFNLFVTQNRLEIAFKIADPTFFKSITTQQELEYGMLALLLLTIEVNLDEAKDRLRYFRHTLSKELQNEEIFKCTTEFILVAISQDKDWLIELQSHFSSLIKRKFVLRKLVQKFISKYFPETKKANFFNLFKFE